MVLNAFCLSEIHFTNHNAIISIRLDIFLNINYSLNVVINENRVCILINRKSTIKTKHLLEKCRFYSAIPRREKNGTHKPDNENGKKSLQSS